MQAVARLTSARTWFAILPLLLTPQAMRAQAPAPLRVVTVTAGVGNAMGWFGAQGERYFRPGRVSAFVGAGWTPSLDQYEPSGPTFAAGLRGYTAGFKHRGFLEASVSQIFTEVDALEHAYVEGNDSLAAALDDIDDRLDELHADYIQAIFESHRAEHVGLQAAVQLALVGRYYERIVAAIEAENAGIDLSVTANASIVGAISGARRQVDVLIDARWGDDLAMRVIVDAKHYKDKLDIKDIESFLSMMEDCRASRGILYCPHGCSPAAKRRAQDAVTISLLGLDDLDYS